MNRDTKRKIGNVLLYGGLTGQVLLYLASILASKRAANMLSSVKKNPGSAKWDINESKYSLNKLENGKVSVFTDADAALKSLYPSASKIRKFFLKRALTAMIKNPQYRLEPRKSVYIDRKFLGTKMLAHELGHAADEELNSKDFSMWSRHPFLPRNLIPGLYNPDKAAILKQEIKAWDNAGVPAGDPVREKALDTYRAMQRYMSYSLPLLALSLGGFYLAHKNRRGALPWA